MNPHEIDIAAYEGLHSGSLFGSRYRLVTLLGRGGFGKVFLARDTALEIPVALKILHPLLASEPAQLSRFKREVIIARKVSHPNVCKIFDFGQIDALTYLSMEYVHGQNLYAVLARHQKLAVEVGLEVGRQICLALAAAHREGIVHRDLKPHNVMLDARGLVKIMDFGIARATDLSGMTHTGTVMGSPTYMSPEQCRGEAGDHRSDLYSLGVVLYQTLTGVSPFVGNTPLGTLYLHIQQEPRPPLELEPELPEPVNALILRCMAKDPAARFQSADALAEDIVAALRSLRESATPERLAGLVQVEDRLLDPSALPSETPPELAAVGDSPQELGAYEETSEISEDTDSRLSGAMKPTRVLSQAEVPPATPSTPRYASAPAQRLVADRVAAPSFGAPAAAEASAPTKDRSIAVGGLMMLVLGGALGVLGYLGWGLLTQVEPLEQAPAPTPTAAPTPAVDPHRARIEELLATAERLYAEGQIDTGPQGGAATLYRRVLLLDPLNAQAGTRLDAIVSRYRREAVAALSAGRYQEALEQAQAALVHLPEDVSAREIFRKALDKMIQVSGATSASLVRARQLIASNEPQAARLLLQEILAAEPEHREAGALDRRAQELIEQLESAAEAQRKAEAEAAATQAAAEPTPEPAATATITPEPIPTAPPATPIPEVREGDLVELGPGIQPPVLQDEVRLRLPASFVSLYRGSTIEAQVLVSESGEVIDARIDSSPQRTANTAVLQQLHRLRFEPARVGKVRVRCWFPMRISIQ